MGGEKQEHIPPFVGLPVGGIAMNCPICKSLEEVCESRTREYVKALSGAYYQVSTELAAYKNVEMERARSELEEHRCVCAPKARQSTHSIRGAEECEWQRRGAIRIGASRN